MEPSTSNDIKMRSLKDPSIPYILNGELYQILTQQGDNVSVKCSSCPSDRVYRGSVRSTGNFHMHIKRRHPQLLGKLHVMKVRSLLERRERLSNAKKLVNKMRIKKIISKHSEKLISEPIQCEGITMQPIDYSCKSEIHSQTTERTTENVNVFLNEEVNSNSPIQNAPLVLATTQVHCDNDDNMGVQRTPIFLTAFKEESLPLSDNEQAMDLTTSSSRNCESGLSQQSPDLQWTQVLQRVETSLKNIENTLKNIQQEIETNRILLDLAKFKYHNSNVHYQ